MVEVELPSDGEVPDEIVRGGPLLAILTALVNIENGSLESLASVTGYDREVVSAALRELSQLGWVTTAAHRWQISITGYEGFYRILGGIRDTLAPFQKSATLPFTMRTTWRECLCLNYAVDPAALRPLVPDVFDLVTHQQRALLSVTVASLSSMRPTGLPALVGKNFCHLTIRAVVQFRAHSGRNRTGYTFVESVTNSPLFSLIGNSVTEFRFHKFRNGVLHFLRQGDNLFLAAEEPSLNLKLVVSVETDRGTDKLPSESIFSSREELDATLINVNDAFGYDSNRPSGVYCLSIDRDRWDYCFVQPQKLYFSYFEEGAPFGQDNSCLDSVLFVRNVEYRWKPLEFEARMEC